MNKLLFGEKSHVIRHDIQPFPVYFKMADRARSFYWTHDSVDLSKDKSDNKSITDNQRFIFTEVFKRQVTLDSKQTRCLMEMFGPFISDVGLEEAIREVEYFEAIHSRTYSYVIQNLYSDPSVIFDEIENNSEINTMVDDIDLYYETFYKRGIAYISNEEHLTGGHKALYDLKRHCLMAIYAWNALESIRFMVSFACTFAFAENNLFHGNASLISKIAKDELMHQAISTRLLKDLKHTDEDFANLMVECKDDIESIYKTVIDQEINWAKYIFKNGSILGLNEKLMIDYIKETAYKRTRAVGVELEIENVPSKPTLPWMDSWLKGGEVQVAPQEKSITEYIIGKDKKDLAQTDFSDMSL